MPEPPASFPDHDTVKLADDCWPTRLPIDADGSVVSSVIASETGGGFEVLPSRSRNWAYSVLPPSPVLSWNRVLVAYGCQLAPVKEESSDNSISVTPALSDADSATVTVRELAKAALLLIVTEPLV